MTAYETALEDLRARRLELGEQLALVERALGVLERYGKPAPSRTLRPRPSRVASVRRSRPQPKAKKAKRAPIVVAPKPAPPAAPVRVLAPPAPPPPQEAPTPPPVVKRTRAPQTCGKCDQVGHNSRACPQSETTTPAQVDALTRRLEAIRQAAQGKPKAWCRCTAFLHVEGATQLKNRPRCGAMVRTAQRTAHLAEVHELDQVEDVGEFFEPVEGD